MVCAAIAIGRITCIGQHYADGVEKRSIEVPKNDASGLPYEIGQRVPVALVVGDATYRAGLRATKRNRTVWISPDLRDHSGTNVRLADIISAYRCNQLVEIEASGKVLRVRNSPGETIRKPKQAAARKRPIPKQPPRLKPRRRGGSSLGRTPGFRASKPAPHILDPKIAEKAIRDYNTDSKVVSQEEMAFRNLGQGLRRSLIESQLRTLNAAYSTRCSLDDLAIIAAVLRSKWSKWQGRLSEVTPLDKAVPDKDSLTGLLTFFLDQPTARTPRSLATKVLHFARPQSFIATDTYAADKIGDELLAGSWADTERLGAHEMALWYRDYLALIREVGRQNNILIAKLRHLDDQTAPQAWNRNLRGLPKLIDKILWWAGREERRGNPVRIFLLPGGKGHC